MNAGFHGAEPIAGRRVEFGNAAQLPAGGSGCKTAASWLLCLDGLNVTSSKKDR